MIRALSSLLFAVACLAAVPASAQQLELPRASPNAKVTQTVGLTDITIEYSSPAVKGRKIWGGLVAYGTPWRAGANAPTKLTFSRDVTIGSTAVPAGTYQLYIIPNAKAPWTVIVSKDLNPQGVFAYKKEGDLLRLDVKPTPIPPRERLAYLVASFTNDTASIDLEWEKVRLSIPVKLNTEAQVAGSLKALDENAWLPYNAVARYFLEQKKDYDAGLKYVELSLKQKEAWLNVWTKAELLAAKGQHKEALPLAQRAQELGQKAPRFFFADEVKKALTEWKAK